ncbi:MAG: thioredoxin domain-containing protein [Rhodothermales bacterium]
MNSLKDEQSPYLLQHKDNPVDWRPWGDEAFRMAALMDRPIFLSIGYSTCHWCHVMEQESFLDDEVAGLLNDGFVSIKVDREERPDVDGVYMSLCQMLTGQGGWPLTVILTPDKKPFFIGTYVPKYSRFGRSGMMELLPHIMNLWDSQRSEVLEAADQHHLLLRNQTSHSQAGGSLALDSIDIAFDELRTQFDTRFGGFGAAPKFPTSHRILFLLRFWHASKDTLAMQMCSLTLRRMRMGGVFDHLGYGFHRYSTDREWKLPHFEKMLYDQAMIALACIEMHQASGDPAYAAMVDELFAYVLRDLRSPEGAFFSAEDADSEGVEGKYYVWTVDAVRETLGPSLAPAFIEAYGLAEDGNVEDEATGQKTGENMLYLKQQIADLAVTRGIAPDVLEDMLQEAREKLLAARLQRPRPRLDDKILTDWNGLMIVALARAGAILDNPAYVAAAREAMDFILSALRRTDGRLLHRYRAGHAGIDAHLDDYAATIWALIELYEACFDLGYLELAVELTDLMIADFWDRQEGGFFFTPAHGEELLVRQKEVFDGAAPSGNSMAMLCLLRLSRMTGRTDFEEKADAIGQCFSKLVYQTPSSFTAMLCAVDYAIGPAQEIVIVGDPVREDTRALIRAVRARYLPNKVVLLRPPGEAGERLGRLAPYTRSLPALNGKAAVYVCEQFACSQPVTRPEDLDALLWE